MTAPALYKAHISRPTGDRYLASVSVFEAVRDWLEQHGRSDALLMFYDNIEGMVFVFSDRDLALQCKLSVMLCRPTCPAK